MQEDRIIIFSFQDYLRDTNFFKTERKEQIALLLFYVTEVCELRNDMLPRIIADRINDQVECYNNKIPIKGKRLKETSKEEVERIVEENIPDVFVESSIEDVRDRSHLKIHGKLSESPVMLSSRKKQELWKMFDGDIIKKYAREWFFYRRWVACLICLLVFFLFCIGVYVRNESLGMSWQEFEQRAAFDKLEDTDRALCVLFYITEMMEFKESMSPEVLADRLHYLGYPNADASEINAYFANNPYVMISNENQELYQITARGKKYFFNLLNIVSIKDEKMTLRYLIENMTFENWSLLVGFIVFLCSVFYGLGHSRRFLWQDRN